MKRLLVSILILAAALRFIGLMPNVIHPDEGVLQIYSWNLIKGVASGDFDPHIFKYGTLNFYFQAAAAAPIFLIPYFFEAIKVNHLPFSEFHSLAVNKYDDLLLFASRAVTAVFGVASVYLVFKIGEKLFDNRIGLLAALLLAVTPTHAKDSHYATTDIPMVFFVLLSFYLLVLLVKEKSLKWYLASGLTLGISVTIKFFPVAFLAFPVAILLSWRKNKHQVLKTAIAIGFILLGVFLGLPFLFLDPVGPKLFAEDLAKYALPWYGNPLTSYFLNLPKLSPLSTLLPQRFQPFFINFLLFQAYGILPTALALLGMIVLLVKDFKKFLLLIPIPLVNFIFITGYLPVYYERLILPTVAFLVFFSALAIDSLVSLRRAPLWFLTGVVIFQPLFLSSQASLACQQKRVEDKSKAWIEANIPSTAKIAYMPEVGFPPVAYADLLRLQPDEIFSLEEVKEKGFDYVFINAGKLEYFTYMYFLHFFPPPAESYQNSYIPLALTEYFSRAKLINKIEKPLMCDNSRIYFFELSDTKREGEKEVVARIDVWEKEMFDKRGFTPPRLKSQPIKVTPRETYFLSGRVKAVDESLAKNQRVYLRIDFYPHSHQTNWLKQGWYLFQYGLTPLTFEKSMGRTSALSSRRPLTGQWQPLEVIARAPDDAQFAILSISTYSSDGTDLYLDNFRLESSK